MNGDEKKILQDQLKHFHFIENPPERIIKSSREKDDITILFMVQTAAETDPQFKLDLSYLFSVDDALEYFRDEKTLNKTLKHYLKTDPEFRGAIGDLLYNQAIKEKKKA